MQPADKSDTEPGFLLPILPRLDIRRVVTEAAAALALLDAVHLEELANSCQKLRRALDFMPPADRLSQAREAAGAWAVFTHVLEATRANLDVMRRLRDRREGRLEYAPPTRPIAETFHGND